MHRRWFVVLFVLAGAATAWAGALSPQQLIEEFTGSREAVERTPQQLEAAYNAVIDHLLPGMSVDDIPKRQTSEQTLQNIAWRAGRPGAEVERAAISRAMAARLSAQLALPARIWLIKQLKDVGGDEAVDSLAAQLRAEEVRERARKALTNIASDKAFAALRAELARAKTPEWRLALINSLAYARDKASVQAVMRSAGDSHEGVRIAALRALAEMGDKTATSAIAGAMGKGSDRAKAIATEAYVTLAESLVTKGDKATALTMYRKLLGAGGHIRCAAIIGVGRAGGVQELETIFAALADEDHRVRGAALEALGLLPAKEVSKAMIARMKTAEPAMKIVLIRALVRGGDPETLPTLLAAASDADENVRIAAYEGMGEIRNERAAPVLIKAMAKGEGKEFEAARNALNVIPGDAVSVAMAKAIPGATPKGQAELVRCLAIRRTPSVASSLLALVKHADAKVRTEALKGIADVADASALPAVLERLLTATDGRERTAAENAVSAICKRTDDEDARSAPVIAAYGKASTTGKISLIGVLGRLGGAKAEATVRTALKDGNAGIRGAAIRTLPSWPTLTAATELLNIAKSEAPLAHRVLALRGAVDVAGSLASLPPEDVLKLYETAMAAAPRPEDRKMVLAGMSKVGNLGALKIAQRCLEDKDLRSEAEVAVVTIAGAISGVHKDKAKDVLEEIIEFTDDANLKKKAREALDRIQKFDDYITAWLYAGPYVKGDLFGTAYPPEKGDKNVGWKTLPASTSRDRPWLLEFDKTPGLQGSNRAVYIRTRVYAADKTATRMELGSDDGVKVWLNGALVHENNTTRPCSPGQDKKQLMLEKGWNDLMMKVTQGGGEWSACLRFRDPAGGKLEGLRADPAGR